MRLRVILPLVLGLMSSCFHEVGSGAEEGTPGLTEEAAYIRAVALQRAGDHLESVPLFRRVVMGHPGISRLHLEYGEALHNAAIETDLSRGFVRFVVPSSRERAALVREAILEMRRAAELARTPSERSYVMFVLGRTESMLGLQADALESIRMAGSLDSSASRLNAAQHSLEAILLSGDAAKVRQ